MKKEMFNFHTEQKSVNTFMKCLCRTNSIKIKNKIETHKYLTYYNFKQPRDIINKISYKSGVLFKINAIAEQLINNSNNVYLSQIPERKAHRIFQAIRNLKQPPIKIDLKAAMKCK